MFAPIALDLFYSALIITLRCCCKYTATSAKASDETSYVVCRLMYTALQQLEKVVKWNLGDSTVIE